jgi:hypothetical protein
MTDLTLQRQQILARIANACTESARDAAGVQLLAVSKTHPAESIRALYLTGQQAFGENYLQEARAKQALLSDVAIEWHFIGHIQRNKTKELAQHFAWVHGVDRLIIAERLSAQRPADLPPLQVCIQVNIDDEDSKDGCMPDALAELVFAISRLPQLRLRGVMVIPAKNSTDAFVRTHQLFEQVRTQHAQPMNWDTLSMGMSGDLESAVAAGATIVRVGTALFGARPPKV